MKPVLLPPMKNAPAPIAARGVPFGSSRAGTKLAKAVERGRMGAERKCTRQQGPALPAGRGERQMPVTTQ